MYSWELHQILTEFSSIRDFLTELAARESELAIAGLGSVASWPSYRACAPFMEHFDASVHNVLRHARIFDREIYESMRAIIDQSGLSEAISLVYTKIELAHSRKTAASLASLRGAILETLSYFAKPKKLFVDEQLSLNKIMGSTSRLHSLLSLLRERELTRYHGDDYSFKPSNVNVDRILEYVDKALDHVREDLGGDPQTRDITVYLEFVKQELADNTPSWKNIVGALVIAATILGGIAAAPEAYRNVKAALDHILGTSVEKTLAPSSPPLLPKKSDGDLDNEVIET